MKYVLLLMGKTADPECGEVEGPDPAEFARFDQEITAAGVVLDSFALEGPETAVRVGTDDAPEPAVTSEPVVTSGPFAESREFVGGGYVIDVTHLDEAIAWAKKSPGARFGWIEIRPLADY